MRAPAGKNAGVADTAQQFVNKNLRFVPGFKTGRGTEPDTRTAGIRIVFGQRLIRSGHRTAGIFFNADSGDADPLFPPVEADIHVPVSGNLQGKRGKPVMRRNGRQDLLPFKKRIFSQRTRQSGGQRAGKFHRSRIHIRNCAPFTAANRAPAGSGPGTAGTTRPPRGRKHETDFQKNTGCIHAPNLPDFFRFHTLFNMISHFFCFFFITV